jgi:hypothetical protein
MVTVTFTFNFNFKLARVNSNFKLELLPIYQSRCHIMPVAVVYHASGDSEATTRLPSQVDSETALARDLPCKPVTTVGTGTQAGSRLRLAP